jgi:hypothetical protein
LGLPPERWDFSNFYSEKPDEVDSFACKVLAAGAVGIYLDILERSGLEAKAPDAEASGNTERVAKIFNSLLRAISIDRTRPPAEVDPFELDEGLRQPTVDDSLRESYRKRTANLFASFEEKYQGRNLGLRSVPLRGIRRGHSGQNRRGGLDGAMRGLHAAHPPNHPARISDY